MVLNASQKAKISGACFSLRSKISGACFSLRSKISAIGKAHNLCFIILHGSYANGTPSQGSDLDIALLGKKPFSFGQLLDIQGKLGDVFGDNQERELDVKSLHGVDSLFRWHVVKDGILLYGARTEYNEFRAYAYRDYMDSWDLRQLEYRLTLAKVRKIDALLT